MAARLIAMISILLVTACGASTDTSEEQSGESVGADQTEPERATFDSLSGLFATEDEFAAAGLDFLAYGTEGLGESSTMKEIADARRENLGDESEACRNQQPLSGDLNDTEPLWNEDVLYTRASGSNYESEITVTAAGYLFVSEEDARERLAVMDRNVEECPGYAQDPGEEVLVDDVLTQQGVTEHGAWSYYGQTLDGVGDQSGGFLYVQTANTIVRYDVASNLVIRGGLDALIDVAVEAAQRALYGPS